MKNKITIMDIAQALLAIISGYIIIKLLFTSSFYIYLVSLFKHLLVLVGIGATGFTAYHCTNEIVKRHIPEEEKRKIRKKIMDWKMV